MVQRSLQRRRAAFERIPPGALHRSLMQPQGAVITRETRDDVQMCVRDDLPGELAFRQEVADAFSEPGTPLRSTDCPGELEHAPGAGRIDLAEALMVSLRDDQRVPRSHRKEVHEDGDTLVAVHETRSGLSGEDLAEDAVGSGAHSGANSHLALIGWQPVANPAARRHSTMRQFSR